MRGGSTHLPHRRRERTTRARLAVALARPVGFPGTAAGSRTPAVDTRGKHAGNGRHTRDWTRGDRTTRADRTRGKARGDRTTRAGSDARIGRHAPDRTRGIGARTAGHAQCRKRERTTRPETTYVSGRHARVCGGVHPGGWFGWLSSVMAKSATRTDDTPKKTRHERPIRAGSGARAATGSGSCARTVVTPGRMSERSTRPDTSTWTVDTRDLVEFMWVGWIGGGRVGFANGRHAGESGNDAQRESPFGRVDRSGSRDIRKTRQPFPNT